MKETVCISVKALYEKFGENLTHGKIKYIPVGEENPNCGYYDLFDIKGNMVCMDGEECTVDDFNLINIEGDTKSAFTLTSEEYEVATFKK